MNEYLERKMRELDSTPVVFFSHAYIKRFGNYRISVVRADVDEYVKEGTIPAYVFWYINRMREVEDENRTA